MIVYWEDWKLNLPFYSRTSVKTARQMGGKQQPHGIEFLDLF